MSSISAAITDVSERTGENCRKKRNLKKKTRSEEEKKKRRE